MFAVVAAGRPVLTQFVQSEETKILFEIPGSEAVNHITVFMTGGNLLPDGYGAAVYFFWPSSGWTLLGFLSNDKQSAVFKISGLKQAEAAINPFGGQSHTCAQVGVSIESVTALSQLTPASNTQPTQIDSYLQFSTKMAEGLYNYTASFAIADPSNGQNYVPLQKVSDWYESFKRKLAINPNFWRT